MLSLQASYAAPLILLAQNRQEARDRVIVEQDREANARAHADMEFLAREVASLRMAVGEVATRDYPALRAARAAQRPRRASARPLRRGTTPPTRVAEAPRSLEHMSTPLPRAGRAALATVNDPEIKRPITDLGMVESRRHRRPTARSASRSCSRSRAAR